MRQCSKCSIVKPLNEFWKNSSSTVGYYSICKVCGTERDKRRWKSTKQLDYKLRRTYNITLEQAEYMLSKQGGRCANQACQRPLSFGAARKADVPYMDHDHRCCSENVSCGNCIRGLLCLTCNVGLGMFMDSMNMLDGIKEYLSIGHRERLNSEAPDPEMEGDAIVRSHEKQNHERVAEMTTPTYFVSE